MSKKLMALVKWIGGADDRKYTVGVPVDWIKSFNYDEYASTTEEKTYVIEWHGTLKKEPLGGWDCYDAFVVEVSERLSFLKKKLSVIEGVLSPNKICGVPDPLDSSRMAAREIEKNISGLNSPDYTDSEETAIEQVTNDNQTTEKIKGPSKFNSKKAPEKQQQKRPYFPCTADEDQLGIDQGNRNANDNLRRKKTQAGPSKPNKENNSVDFQRRRLDVLYTSDEDESGIVNLNRDSINAAVLKETVKGNQLIEGKLTKVCKELKHRRKRGRRDSDESSSDSSDEERKVRIGPKQSGIYVTDSQWRCAKAQTTYTAMGTSLLMALFPLEVLLKSNLKGGKTRINRSANQPRRQGLDNKIREAIFYTVQSYHPKTFNPTGLGMAINNKLNSLRRAQRRAQNETHPAQGTSESDTEQ